MHASQVGDTLLLHHFDDVDQQKLSSTFGMWVFLVTEVMFFGGLFAAYALYRTRDPEAFALASQHQNVILGFVNTLVLLCSSLTMAFAVRSTQLREMKKVVKFLLWTMVLGITFLVVKGFEWSADYHEHLIPGINWDWDKAQAGKHGNGEESPHPVSEMGKPAYPLNSPSEYKLPQATESGKAMMYFVLYFGMTGLHAFHMIIGIIVVGIMAWLTHLRWMSGGGETQIEVTGLYWHFVDVVWVFLYPLLYLIHVRPLV
jgi:cytochrome c oxidase subunit III